MKKFEKYRLIIFGYNFPHFKSENFIHILKKNNIKVVAFIAADKVKLNLPKKLFNKKIFFSIKPIFHPKDLCKIYKIPFYNFDHNSKRTIKLVKKYKANFGIIAGSRIIKSEIINSLLYGIINFHPGKIPEASGLDALMWSILKNISPFITTHFIDRKIDAGKKIYQKKVKVDINDRIEDIKFKMSQLELEQLERLCFQYLSKNKNIKAKEIKNYKYSNKPMSKKLQMTTIKKFDLWKKKILQKK